MLPPVIVRNATRIGGWLQRKAKLLGERTRAAGRPLAHEVVDGFIIRAQRAVGQRYLAQIVDTPTFLLMPGFNAITPTVSLFLVGVPVGSRDDLVVPDNGASHQVVSAPGAYRGYLLQPSSAPDNLGDSPTNYAPSSAHTVQLGKLIGYGYFVVGLRQSATGLAFYALDDMSYFTFSERCAAGCGMTSPFAAAASLSFDEAGTPSVSELRQTYLNGAGMWLTEQDLTAGWLLHPRRQVPHTTYTSLSDDYRNRRSRGPMNTGFALAPAEGTALIGTDRYCVAARGFKQYVGTWFQSPPGSGYRPPYYDRDGEQALVIATGHFDRPSYTGAQALATVDSIRYFKAADVPVPEVRPYPATIPGNDWGRPALPGVAQFFTPWVGRVAGGFVTFATYSALVDRSADAGASPNWTGLATALVVVGPAGDQAFVADWDAGVGAPLVPGASAGRYVLPVIVGGTTVDLPAAIPGDPPIPTACCLVWEQWYNRFGVGDPNARGQGGELVLYRATSATVTRTVVTSTYAPLIASTLARGPLRLDEQQYAADPDDPFGNVAWIGGTKIATAVVASPVATPATATATTVPAHDILVLVYDLQAGTFELTPAVASRTSILRKCLLSAPRLESQVLGRPAILLASLTEATPTNQGAGQVYIRHVDSGGASPWRPYVADLGGQGGAFYVGNKLWWFDTTGPLTIGGLQ